MATPLSSEQLERLVHANAAAMDLRIAVEHRAGVAVHFRLAADMAALLMSLPLGPEDESGSVFTPVSPELGS